MFTVIINESHLYSFYYIFLNIIVSGMAIPALHVPIRCILHVHHVVDVQLLPGLDLLYGSNTGYKPQARMVSICPAAVRSEAVVYLVCKCGSVGGRIVVLKLETVR